MYRAFSDRKEKNMEYKKVVVEVLESMGIYIDPEEESISLHEYIVDSIQFITFIVNLEEKLEFTFPDEYLLYDSIATIDLLCEIIDQAKS